MGKLSAEEVEEYFADRQAHGFNTAGWVDSFALDRDFPDNATGWHLRWNSAVYGNVAGGTDFTHYDLSKPNEAYFVRLDHVDRKRGEARHLCLHRPGWRQSAGCRSSATTDCRRVLCLRTISRPSLQEVQQRGMDKRQRLHPMEIPADDALALAVAKRHQSVAPEQLQTVELNVTTSSSLDDQSWAPLISLNSTYTYSATYIQVLHSYNQTPVMPAYLVEAHYDMEEGGRRNGLWNTRGCAARGILDDAERRNRPVLRKSLHVGSHAMDGDLYIGYFGSEADRDLEGLLRVIAVAGSGPRPGAHHRYCRLRNLRKPMKSTSTKKGSMRVTR